MIIPLNSEYLPFTKENFPEIFGKRAAEPDHNEDYECSICLASIVSEEGIFKNAVAHPKGQGGLHPFHAKCLNDWILSHDSCPLCRLSVKINSVGTNHFNSGPIQSRPSLKERTILEIKKIGADALQGGFFAASSLATGVGILCGSRCGFIAISAIKSSLNSAIENCSIGIFEAGAIGGAIGAVIGAVAAPRGRKWEEIKTLGAIGAVLGVSAKLVANVAIPALQATGDLFTVAAEIAALLGGLIGALAGTKIVLNGAEAFDKVGVNPLAGPSTTRLGSFIGFLAVSRFGSLSALFSGALPSANQFIASLLGAGAGSVIQGFFSRRFSWE